MSVTTLATNCVVLEVLGGEGKVASNLRGVIGTVSIKYI